MFSNEDNLLNKKKQINKKELLSSSQEDVYIVEAIRDKKKIKNKWFYKIKWFNYPENQNTWEPKENLMCDELLEKFEKSWKEKHTKKEKPKCIIRQIEKLESEKNSQSIKSIENLDEKDELIEFKMKNKIKKKNYKNDKPVKKIQISFKKNYFKEENFQVNNTIINNNNFDSKSNKLSEENIEAFFDTKGSINNNIPKRILSARFKEDKTLEFLVMWRKKNGFKPSDSYVSNEDLKKYKYYDLIIDFYELRTRFQNESNESKKAVNSNDSTHENK